MSSLPALRTELDLTPALYDRMCRAIAVAYEVDEVKDIRDKALAIEIYSRQAQNTENERNACRIRLRAERRAGELIAEMEKAKGAAVPGIGKRGGTVSNGATPLAELGISRDQSSKWQKLAAVSEPEFEAALAGAEKPSTTGIIRAADPPPVVPVSSEALWVWGRLRDFERNILNRDPPDILRTMTEEMLDDVYSLAPRVAHWLQRIGEPS